MNTAVSVRHDVVQPQAGAEKKDFVTLTIDGQLFGIPVLSVRDMLGPQTVTQIPLANSVVAGSLNLRGRIVTVIDIRKRLELPERTDGGASMNVVVKHESELYSLVIDAVGEVMSLPAGQFEDNPATLEPIWRNFSNGIYRLDEGLMIVLDVERLLDI